MDANCPICNSELEYKGHYGAPGIGISAHCNTCDKPWSVIGYAVHDPADMEHIMSPEDCI